MSKDENDHEIFNIEMTNTPSTEMSKTPWFELRQENDRLRLKVEQLEAELREPSRKIQKNSMYGKFGVARSTEIPRLRESLASFFQSRKEDQYARCKSIIEMMDSLLEELRDGIIRENITEMDMVSKYPEPTVEKLVDDVSEQDSITAKLQRNLTSCQARIVTLESDRATLSLQKQQAEDDLDELRACQDAEESLYHYLRTDVSRLKSILHCIGSSLKNEAVKIGESRWHLSHSAMMSIQKLLNEAANPLMR